MRFNYTPCTKTTSELLKITMYAALDFILFQKYTYLFIIIFIHFYRNILCYVDNVQKIYNLLLFLYQFTSSKNDKSLH